MKQKYTNILKKSTIMKIFILIYNYRFRWLETVINNN
jgi:hypothetical protein